MRLPLLLPALLLAACATPRDACINSATREVRVLDGLIAETRANIARGFAIEETEEVRTVRRSCEGTNDDGSTFTFPCEDIRTRTVREPVAIDLNAERAKLESLLERQAQNRAIAEQQIQQCVATYRE